MGNEARVILGAALLVDGKPVFFANVIGRFFEGGSVKVEISRNAHQAFHTVARGRNECGGNVPVFTDSVSQIRGFTSSNAV
jgi:hypothetical protein